MHYLEFIFTLSPSSEAAYDVFERKCLAEIGFESFVHTDELDLPRVAINNNFPESAVFADKADEDTFKAYNPDRPLRMPMHSQLSWQISPFQT